MIKNPKTGKMILANGATAKKLLEMHNIDEIKLDKKTVALISKKSAPVSGDDVVWSNLPHDMQLEVLKHTKGYNFANKSNYESYLKRARSDPIKAFVHEFGSKSIKPPHIDSFFSTIFDPSVHTNEFNFDFLELNSKYTEMEHSLSDHDHDNDTNKLIEKEWLKTNKDDVTKFIKFNNQLLIKSFSKNIEIMQRFKETCPELASMKLKTYSDIVTFVDRIPPLVKIRHYFA